MYKNMYSHLQHYTEEFHCPKNPLCSIYSPSPHHPHKPLAATDLFTVYFLLKFCLFQNVTELESYSISLFRFASFAWYFTFRVHQWLSGKESTCNTADEGLIPGSGRSPGGGHGNPLLYSCLENAMDRGVSGRLQSKGLQRVGHDWNNLAHMHTHICICLGLPGWH